MWPKAGLRHPRPFADNPLRNVRHGPALRSAVDLAVHDVVVHDHAGARAGVRPEFAARVDAGVDPGVHEVAHDRAELAPAGVDQHAVHLRPVILAVVPQVGHRRARAPVDLLADDGIAAVAEVADGRLGEKNGVLDLHRLADMAAVADARGAAEVAVRTDLAVLPDHDVALDEHPRQDAAALAEHQPPFNRGARAEIPADVVRLQGAHDFFIQLQQVPRVKDGHAVAVGDDGLGLGRHGGVDVHPRQRPVVLVLKHGGRRRTGKLGQGGAADPRVSGQEKTGGTVAGRGEDQVQAGLAHQIGLVLLQRPVGDGELPQGAGAGKRMAALEVAGVENKGFHGRVSGVSDVPFTT